MSVRNFWIYFNDCKENLKSFNFTDDKLFSLSADLALKLVEADLKEKEAMLTREKLKKEMEGLILQNKTQTKQLEFEILKSIVQAESMVRSVGDNACINRSNAYVGFLNVVGNASESSAIATHSNNVVNEIKKIDDTALTNNYKDIFTRAREDFLKELSKLGKMRECFIIYPRSEIKIREPIELIGFSIYPQNESVFEFKGQTLENSQLLDFSSEEEGEFEIIFKVKNDLEEWIQDKIIIKVTKF